MVKPVGTSINNVSDEQPRSESSKYKGVRKRKWGKWVSEIRLPNSRERIWLGSYDSPEKAARAFDAALFCLRGHHAKFNFPETPPEIVGAQSLAPQEIQEVAARFANEREEQPKEADPVTDQYYGSSSSSSDGAAVLQPDTSTTDMATDWSFLSLLDSNHNAYDDFHDHFSGLDKLHSDELSLLPLDPDTDTYYRGDDNDEYGAFYQQSFLWNF